MEDESFRGLHLFGLKLPSYLEVKAIKEKIQKNKISVSFRGDAIGVAPNVYNDKEDMIKPVNALSAP